MPPTLFAGDKKQGFRLSVYVKCLNKYGAHAIATIDIIVKEKHLNATDLLNLIEEQEEEGEMRELGKSFASSIVIVHVH